MTATDPTTTIVAVAIVAGYAWLLVLTTHVQVLSRRLGQHICRDPHPLITVAQLQRRAGAPHLPELATEDEFDGHSDRVEQDRHPAHAATSSPPCPARPRPCPLKLAGSCR